MIFSRLHRILPLATVAKRLHDEGGQTAIRRQSRFSLFSKPFFFTLQCLRLKIGRSEPKDTLH